MSLTAGRNTVERGNKTIVLDVKSNTRIYEGAMVALDDGYAVSANAKATLVVAGRCEAYVDNTGTGGTNGAKQVTVKRGVFAFENDTENPVTNAHLLKECYVLDDCTVTSDSTDTCVAGKVIGFEDGQVFVEII